MGSGTTRYGGKYRKDSAEQPLSLQDYEYTTAMWDTHHFLWSHYFQVLYFFLFLLGCLSYYTDDFVLQ